MIYMFIYLFESWTCREREREGEEETERESLHLLIHFPHGYNSQGSLAEARSQENYPCLLCGC